MSSGEEKKILLSVTKLTTLLSNHSYSLISTYCVGEDVRFVEVRTPRFQKTFVIYIPPKYKMVHDDAYKRLQITPINASLISSRQLDYLIEVKGPLIDCDLLSISSTILCLYKNNGSIDHYKIGEHEIRDVDETVEEDEPEIGSVEKIISDAAQLMKQLEPENETENQILDNTEVLPETDTLIELEFEEDENEPTHLMKSSEDDIQPANLEDVKEKEESKISHSKPLKRMDNPMPPELEDSDIRLGIIYYSVDVGLFYKNAVSLEEDIMGVYNTLDDNEDSLRTIKVTEITVLTEKIIQKANEIAEKIKKDETEIKAQLITLSTILDKTEAFEAKMETDRKKFASVKPDIDRIHTQTKTTIYDINVELLRIRDSADDLLHSIQTSLHEILNI